MNTAESWIHRALVKEKPLAELHPLLPRTATVMNSLLSVFFTLLFLYALPLILLIISIPMPATVGGFHSFVVAVLEVYITPVRDALASFVMPFAAAFAISTISSRTRLGKHSSIIFYSLVALALISVAGASYMKMHGNEYVAQYGGAEEVNEAVLGLCALYLKESLAYISLILGIGGASLARRQNDNVKLDAS